MGGQTTLIDDPISHSKVNNASDDNLVAMEGDGEIQK